MATQGDIPAALAMGSGEVVRRNALDTDFETFIPSESTPTGSQLISGGGVAWTGTGFNYIISAAVYLINGVQYSSAQTPVTLTAADMTFDRIDVFYVDTSGLANFITGTPAATPVAPSVDPVTQLYLTFAYVPANSTAPVITNVNIYLENTEYTMSTNSAGTINLASTNNPYAGTKCIEGTTTVTGNLFTAVKPSGTLDISVYQSLVFQIRSKATWPNPKSLSVFWLNGTTVIGTSVTLHNGVFGFDSSQTSSYQQIVIPISNFNTGTTVIDRLRVAVAGGGGSIGWYIDNIILQSGSGGGGGGSGDFSTNTSTSIAGEVVEFADTTGKLGRRSSTTATVAKVTAGVLGSASAGTDYANLTFKTIAVSGQSDVVADSAADTLTLAAGSNVTITTNAGTDTVTIASSAPGTGTVTTTGSPASGNLSKFSGATSITNADLTGDVTTSGTVAATIANSAVTYAKMQNVSANSKVLGSSATGSGSPPSELTLGTNLSMSGSTINATGGGTIASTTNLLVGDGSGNASSASVGNVTTGFRIGGVAASGKILVGDGTNYVASTPTFPNAASTSGKVVVSDGTNFVTSTPTFPNASATSGKFIRSDGTNWIASTPTLPTSAGTSGKLLSSDGTNYIETTPTYPNTATSGKVLIGDGTNVVLSTPTFPNASATSGKVIKSDGTNWVASTETYAAPGTSGNVLTSDGTNWTSAAAAGGGTTVKVSGSNFTTTSASLVDVTGLSITPASSSLYEVDVLLRVQSTTTDGMNIGMAQSGTGGTLSVVFMSQTTTGNGAFGVTSAFTTGHAAASTANTDSFVILKGVLVTAGSPGNITVQVSKTTTGTATVYIGSRLTMTKLS